MQIHVSKSFELTTDSGEKLVFGVGANELPDALRDHWYVRAMFADGHFSTSAPAADADADLVADLRDEIADLMDQSAALLERATAAEVEAADLTVKLAASDADKAKLQKQVDDLTVKLAAVPKSAVEAPPVEQAAPAKAKG